VESWKTEILQIIVITQGTRRHIMQVNYENSTILIYNINHISKIRKKKIKIKIYYQW